MQEGEAVQQEVEAMQKNLVEADQSRAGRRSPYKVHKFTKELTVKWSISREWYFYGFPALFDWLGAKIWLNTGELDGSVPCTELAQLAGTHQGAAAGQSAPTPVCGRYSWAIQSYFHITVPGSKTVTSTF